MLEQSNEYKSYLLLVKMLEQANSRGAFTLSESTSIFSALNCLIKHMNNQKKLETIKEENKMDLVIEDDINKVTI